MALFCVSFWYFSASNHSIDRRSIEEWKWASGTKLPAIQALQDHAAKRNSNAVHLMWEGTSMLTGVYRLNLHGLISACSRFPVFMWSNSLLFDPDFPSIYIVRYDATSLMENEPGFDSLNLLREKATNVHWSDFFRLFVIFKFGGLYLDMDMLVVKPICSLLPDKVLIADQGEYSCLTQDQQPGVVVDRQGTKATCVCNCLLRYPPGSPFLRKLLVEAHSYYDIEAYGPMGAVMIMQVLHKSTVEEIRSFELVPLRAHDVLCNFLTLDSSVLDGPVGNDMVRTIEQKCLVIHLYGKGRSEVIISPDNLESVSKFLYDVTRKNWPFIENQA